MIKKKSSRAVTAVIVILILVFLGLIGRTVWIQTAPDLPVANQAPAVRGGSGQGAGQNAGAGGNAGGPAPGADSPGGPGSSGSQGGARTAATVRVTPVERGTIENSVMINGDVLASSQVPIYPTMGGKLSELHFRVGDTVSQGQTVAMVDPSRPGELYSLSPVVSTIGGTVLSAPLNPGDTVSTQSTVYIVGDLSNLVVETFVPERFSNAARRGLGALVSLEALPGESFSATVDEVSPVLDPASRTLRIRLRFNRRDPRIRAGMFATVSLVTNTRRDVPVIPRSSVINTYGSWIVFIADEQNTAQRRVITLGIENETSVEVLSGLEIGEQVVSAGQNFLSEGDLVRVVD